MSIMAPIYRAFSLTLYGMIIIVCLPSLGAIYRAARGAGPSVPWARHGIGLHGWRSLRLRGGHQHAVLDFLKRAGLEAHGEAFAREKIQSHNLKDLEEGDLEELGLQREEIERYLSHVSQPLTQPAKTTKHVVSAEAQKKPVAAASLPTSSNTSGSTKVTSNGKQAAGDVAEDSKVSKSHSDASRSSMSSKDKTRLDTLLLLLSSGTTSISRNTAANQLGQLYRSHTHLRSSLVSRILPLLLSTSWETRSAAGHAVDEMARIQASDEEDASLAEDAFLASLALPESLRRLGVSLEALQKLSLKKEMEDGPFLLASEEIGMLGEVGDSQGGGRRGKGKRGEREIDSGLARGTGKKLKTEGEGAQVDGGKLVISYTGAESESTLTASLDAEGVWPFGEGVKEMIMGLSHARWEVRHGAALGLRHVVRRSYRGRTECSEWKGVVRGIAIALLKVLARDRFSDFSGDLVMSPVRETVSQALGETAGVLDEPSVLAVFRALRSMQAFEGEWEVRQSALLGLKYILAVRRDALAKHTDAAFKMVMAGVNDEDDIRAAAADAAIPLLPPVLADHAGDHSAVALSFWSDGELEKRLWESLKDCDELSSSTAPVMNLLARLLERGGGSQSGLDSDNMVGLWVFVRHQISSVRLATIKIFSQLLKSWGRELSNKILKGKVLSQTLEVLYLSLMLETRQDVSKATQALWVDLVKSCRSDEITSSTAGLWLKMVKAAAFGKNDRIDPKSVCSVSSVTESLASAFSMVVTRRKSDKKKSVKGLKPADGTGGEQGKSEDLQEKGELCCGEVEGGGSEAVMIACKALSQMALHCDQGGQEVALSSLCNLIQTGESGEKLTALHVLLEWALDLHEQSAPLPPLLWPSSVWSSIVSLISPHPPPPGSPLTMCIASIHGVTEAPVPPSLSDVSLSAIDESIRVKNPGASGAYQDAVGWILVDFLRYEVDGVIQHKAAESLAIAIKKKTAGESQVEALCKMLCSDLSFAPKTSNFTTPESLTFQWITWSPDDDVTAIKEGASTRIGRRGSEYALSALCRHFGESLFSDLPSLWSMCAGNDATSSDRDSAMSGLEVSMCLLGNLKGSITSREKLIEAVLPLAFSCVKSERSEVRQMAARLIAEVCKENPLKGITAVIRNIIPLLGDTSNGWVRSGACETLYRVTTRVGQDVLPFAVFFVVPVLGSMSDSISAIRETSTKIFGSLLKILPLEEGVPDPVGLDEDLMTSKKTERAFLEQLLDTSKVEEYHIPVKLNAELRTYQKEGINWLGFLFKYRLHGILCDDMGLGKTIQTIAGMASDIFYRRKLYRESKREDNKPLPSLIVCPSTLVNHWLFEINKFCPEGLEAEAYSGKDAKERAEIRNRLDSTDKIVVMSYESLRNDVQVLIEAHPAWNFAVLDEGHIIKNVKSKMTIAVKSVGNCANHRIILTGTPIQNNVLELWSLFDFLMPGFLGDEAQFNVAYSRPILASGRDLRVNTDLLKKSKAGAHPSSTSSSSASGVASNARDAAVIEAGEQALEKLHRQVLPFMLRRTKAEVLHDLPPKIIQDIICPMSSIQQKLYDDFASSQRRALEARRSGTSPKHDEDAKGTFAALQHLKKLANHPLLAFAPGDDEYKQMQEVQAGRGLPLADISIAPKLVALKNLLLDCGIGHGTQGAAAGSGGHRALIFAQMKSFIDIVEADLLKKEMPSVSYLRMDGSTPPHKRFEMQQTFNSDPTIDVLLLTTRVGGLGLTLTGADTVIFLEHDWNPMKDMQAMDRSHRIGQKKVVNVYRIISQGSIEESIMGLQRFKMNVADSVVNEENNSLQGMDTSNLLDLFAPSSVKVGQSSQADEDVTRAAAKVGGGGGTKIDKALQAAGELWDEEQYDDLGVDAFMGQRTTGQSRRP